MVALSIIIPSYNRLWALPKAVESCRTTQNPHEIIVVDDGSTDGTSDWLSRQPDVTHVRTDNWGKDWAVNKAFSMARGQYVRFLDSDDWLEPDANDAQLEIARRDDADLVVAGYRTVDERSDSWVEAPWKPCEDFIGRQLAASEVSHYSAFLFKRAFVSDVPHRQEYLANDDRMFTLEVALKHPRIAVWDGLAMVHRHHAQGRLQEPAGPAIVAVHLAELAVYRRICRMLQDRGELTAERRAAVVEPLWPLAHQIARYDLAEGAKLYDWILELVPDFQPPPGGPATALYTRLGFRNGAKILRIRRALLGILKTGRARRW